MKNKRDKPHPSEWLSADKPIETRGDDTLGRRGFSEALANAISGWSGQESLVLGLYGAWGNGKSSIKNMAIECLRSNSPAVYCVDFNPWQLATRPHLGEAFFDELGVAIGKGDLGSKSLKRSVLDRYKRWAHRLQGGRDLAQATRNAFGAILVLFGVTTLGSLWIHSRAATIIAGSLFVLFGILAFVSKFMDAAIKFLEAGTEIGAKSLTEVKTEIAQDLRKMKSPILVVLDDLDRLTPQELIEVFQLIKANGDFPNLIYLVLCERNIVETNITKALNVSGREYLEKIVQVAFDIPMIDVALVRQALFTRLNRLLSSEEISTRFVAKRLANVFWSGLHSYFATLRDVNRFVSTLAFQISSLCVNGAFEVNPVDLIVLEVIRLYEPEVYKALQSNKEILTASNRPGKPRSDDAKKVLASIIETGSQHRRDELKEIIKHLFPTIEWAFDGPQYTSDFGQNWYRDLRVCSPKVFDRYFRLTISDQELSQASVQKLLNARGNRQHLRTELEMLHSRRLLSIALEELGVYQDEIEPIQVEPFVTAIFDIGDLFSDEKSAMYELPVHWRAGSLILNSFEKVGDTGERLKILTNAISRTTGLFMAVEFVGIISAPSEDGAKKAVFLEGDLVELKLAALRKIENAAASGTLEQHPRLASLANVWRAWGTNKDAEDYIETITKNPEGTLCFLKSLVVRSLSHQMGDHVGTERYYMRRSAIEPLISIDTLDARVRGLPPEKLTDEDHRAVNAFQKALARRNSGKSDDDPFARD